MAFKNDVVFPTEISKRSSGGSGFKTLILELDSGVEERVQRTGAAGRRQYNVKYGIKSVNDLYEVYKLHIVVQGSTFGFRFRDWLDYSTNQTGLVSSPTPTDVVIGVGDGSQTVFQLQKRYTIGTTTIIRNIEKPDESTVRVALNGIELSSGYTVNDSTGELTALTPPNPGVVVTAGCEFYVPARFGKEVDEYLPIEFADFNAAEIPDIPLIEDIDTRFANEAFNYGGAKNHGNMAGADVSITALQGRVHCFEPTAAGLSVRMPDIANQAKGGPVFFLKNDGTQTLTIRDKDLNAIDSLIAGKSATMLVGVDNALAKVWLAQIN